MSNKVVHKPECSCWRCCTARGRIRPKQLTHEQVWGDPGAEEGDDLDPITLDVATDEPDSVPPDVSEE